MSEMYRKGERDVGKLRTLMVFDWITSYGMNDENMYEKLKETSKTWPNADLLPGEPKTYEEELDERKECLAIPFDEAMIKLQEADDTGVDFAFEYD